MIKQRLFKIGGGGGGGGGRKRCIMGNDVQVANPRNLGNHVTVACPPAPQENQCEMSNFLVWEL